MLQDKGYSKYLFLFYFFNFKHLHGECLENINPMFQICIFTYQFVSFQEIISFKVSPSVWAIQYNKTPNYIYKIRFLV